VPSIFDDQDLSQGTAVERLAAALEVNMPSYATAIVTAGEVIAAISA
jgi:hypothetical protein